MCGKDDKSDKRYAISGARMMILIDDGRVKWILIFGDKSDLW